MYEPLRKCKDCELEAYTKEDLDLFVINKKLKHGRVNLCRKCSYIRIKESLQRKEIKWLEEYDYLRKCSDCGLEAKSEKSLILFIENNDTIFGRRNLCKVCFLKRKNKDLSCDIRLYLRKCKCCGYEAKTKEDLSNMVKSSKALHGRKNLCYFCKREQIKKRRLRDEEFRITENTRNAVRNRKRRKHKRKYVKYIELEEFILRELYSTAKERTSSLGIEFHVDHIYPLNSLFLCGLDISRNMQIVTAEYNLYKNNLIGEEYKEQENITSLYKELTQRENPKIIFELLGCNMTWEEFLEYEKQNYKESLYE